MIPTRPKWNVAPPEVIRRWPGDVPLVVLGSGAGGGRWGRWTILSRPTESVVADGPAAADLLDKLAGTQPIRSICEIPFLGGWIVGLEYGLGGVIEDAVLRRKAPLAQARGLMIAQKCPAAYVHDGKDDSWWRVGHEEAGAELPGEDELLAAGDAERLWKLTLDPASLADQQAYEARVARTVEYILAGDVFQANIARLIHGTFTGSARGLFAAALEQARPWYGAYLEMEHVVARERRRRAIVSISPELFLDYDAGTRLVTTRPIKGTRPGDVPASELELSVKDQAELTMIVDLMRNDLGRVCDIGSVRVVEARTLEKHAGGGTPGQPGVLHGVATVQARLREGLSVADLLRATFPGGSVTGAPKIRAMQIIDELEGFDRGMYTGSIGYLSACGNACFNIAIRTAELEESGARLPSALALDHFEQGRLRFGVGAGIVADSDPAAELQETVDKAGVLRGLARQTQSNKDPAAQVLEGEAVR